MSSRESAWLDRGLPPYPFSDRLPELRARLIKFLKEHVYAAEPIYKEQLAELTLRGQRWASHPAIIDELKAKAKAAGLWNLFLPNSDLFAHSHGLSNLDYAPLAEAMGGNAWAPEVFNCSAPDTGNMEVLARYGSESQRRRWLDPLLDGRIRSAFCMTEPAVASSDATNMELTVTAVPDGYRLSGRKWWASGALDHRCELLVVLGKMADAEDRAPHQAHAMLLVPRSAAGVRVERALSVFGYDDAPHGHAEIFFDDVHVDADSILLGPGRGFEIAQGRLGPGRIHHCMRLVGLAERCAYLAARRASARAAFGSQLEKKDLVRASVAEMRIQIEQARLLVMGAAHLMDSEGNKAARQLIALVKVVAPRMACDVTDRAIQIYGGEGVCQDTPLAYAYAGARTLRLADGPDEVHLLQAGRIELSLQRMARQRDGDDGTAARRPRRDVHSRL